ncbi:MAG: hypothetical protein ACRC4L_02610 [Mycoplasma sp.]
MFKKDFADRIAQQIIGVEDLGFDFLDIEQINKKFNDFFNYYTPKIKINLIKTEDKIQLIDFWIDMVEKGGLLEELMIDSLEKYVYQKSQSPYEFKKTYESILNVWNILLEEYGKQMVYNSELEEHFHDDFKGMFKIVDIKKIGKEGKTELFDNFKYDVLFLMDFKLSEKLKYELIKNELISKGLSVCRVDELTLGNNFVAEIFEIIDKSNIVVVDISTNNNTVYIELGYCLAKNKTIIVVTNNPSDEGYNFYTRNIQIHKLQNTLPDIQSIVSRIERVYSYKKNIK